MSRSGTSTVTRVEPVLWAQLQAVAAAMLEWEDVVGTARVNVRLTALYLAFMFAAGVVACYGVVTVQRHPDGGRRWGYGPICWNHGDQDAAGGAQRGVALRRLAP